MMRRPPRLAAWLLKRALPSDERGDTMRGDLLEELRARDGDRAAAWWFWRQTFSLAVRYGWRRPQWRRATRRAASMSLDNVRQDLRYALRSYMKAPSFTLAVLATLALGIGASTAIFSFVNGILLRPLPLPDSERLVYANEVNPRGDRISVAWPNFLDWRAGAHSFEALAASREEAFFLTGVDRPQRLRGRRVSANFFHVVGVQPSLGRGFAEADDRPGAAPVVVVSDAFWRNELGGDAAAIGRTITLDSQPHTIVGVLPRGFQYIRPYDAFVAMGPLAGEPILERGNHNGFSALGRLKPRVSAEAADREIQAIAADLQRSYPNTNSGVGARAQVLAAQVVGNVRPALLVLLGAVGFLLLMACMNVANLLITRGTARQHELAIRAALGGGRLRLATQLLVESSLVSALGGVLGIVLASALLRLLVAVAPDGTPRLDEVRLDGAALIFGFAAAALCGVVFGALPAVHASSVRGQHLLVRGRSAGASARSHRLRRGLMVVEVALALVLLTGAGLMMRTLRELTSVDIGFRPDHLLTMRLTLTGDRWDDAHLLAFYDDVLGRVRALPGVTAAALTYSLPIDGSNWNSVFIARDKPIPPRAELPSAAFTPVSAGYFETMGTRLIRGRLFTAADGPTTAAAIVINETLARRLWSGEEAIGKRIKQGWPESNSTWREVVGVVADVKLEGLAAITPLQVYLPIAQNPQRSTSIVVRAGGDPAALQLSVESAVHSVQKDLPLYFVRTMEQLLDTSIARERMSMLVLVMFAVVAMTLASVGLYGIVAHGVTERTHEIGVRMALGAMRRHVLALVVRQGLSTALVGAVLGLAGAAVLTRSMEGLLFGVTPTDPLTFAAVIVTLLLVTLVACYVPAWRATRVDPTQALRTE